MKTVTTSIWSRVIRASADPARARHGLERLSATEARDTLAKATPEEARLLAALWSGSPASSELLLKHPEWLASALDVERLRHPRQEQGVRSEVNGWLRPALVAREYANALTQLRLFRQREMVRIAARDLARLGDAPQITRELSDLADVCLSAVFDVCWQQAVERFGTPYHRYDSGPWLPTKFCVLGLGKLGGQELNYSSDVDVIFVYSEEGHVFKEPPRRVVDGERAPASHPFFKRLAEAFVEEATRATGEGALFRVDVRLRPEGDFGPLVRSLASYETFYAQWGQTWERMMLIKARGVAGDRALAGEFLETVQPFRYPRSLNEGALREISAMKTRIENEVVKAGELDRNVKLGRGGIREIEFVAQTLQLLHAGRNPFLQGAQTLPTLKKLVQYHLLDEGEATELAEAYCFLRDVEHRAQMEQYLQTHSIPADAVGQARLAALMGFRVAAAFESARAQHASRVRSAYDKIFKRDEPEPASVLPVSFQGAEAEWKRLLNEHSFRDAEASCRLLGEFVEGPGFGHVSPRTRELAMQLVEKLLALCPRRESGSARGPRVESGGPPDSQSFDFSGGRQESQRNEVFGGPPKTARRRRALPSGLPTQTPAVPPELVEGRILHAPLSDPDRVLARLDRFVGRYGARAMLFETWASQPQLYELLLKLFDRSEFLAEIAIRTPDLVDELLQSGQMRRQKSAVEILRDLQHGHADADQRLWLRRYHRTELMRLGLRDILGLVDYDRNLIELSALADACLQYALEVVLRRHKIKTPPLVIIGLGKLGGLEVNYGSDLDVLFVAPTNAKNLPKLQHLATEIMDLLSARTELGAVFEIDARLRPDGEKGLLVNTLDAYEEYYRRRAQLWEIQALTRTRAVAGDSELGEEFQQMAAALANFHPNNVKSNFALPAASGPKHASREKAKAHAGLAAYTPHWKDEIAQMRSRIEKERTPAGQDVLAIKTGQGGLIDAEFIAQALCLENGWQEANSMRALERARDAGVLPGVESLIENYRRLRRVEGILRRWSYEGETVLPVEPEPYYRVSVRCGFASPEAFRAALAQWREAIHEIFQRVFPAAKNQQKSPSA